MPVAANLGCLEVQAKRKGSMKWERRERSALSWDSEVEGRDLRSWRDFSAACGCVSEICSSSIKTHGHSRCCYGTANKCSR